MQVVKFRIIVIVEVQGVVQQDVKTTHTMGEHNGISHGLSPRIIPSIESSSIEVDLGIRY
jgi:hypothetical protein